jgi:hypothetical protein
MMKRKSFTPNQRYVCLVVWGGRDAYTGKFLGPDNCDLDHIIPHAKGGSNDWENIVPTCKDLNMEKSDNMDFFPAEKIAHVQKLAIEKAPEIRERLGTADIINWQEMEADEVIQSVKLTVNKKWSIKMIIHLIREWLKKGKQALARLANELNKSVASLIGKLCGMGIYNKDWRGKDG